MLNGTPYTEALECYQSNPNRPAAAAELAPQELLKNFHPDYDPSSMVSLQIGPNQGDQCHKQLSALLQSDGHIDEADLADATIIETDVLIIGGGGAGCAAALTAVNANAKVLLATKLRLGDSNTIMAEGGIQASIDKDDTPQMHFNDTYQAGHCQGDTTLIKQLVLDGADVINWLIQQGMQFDTNESGDLLTRRAGGTSADRVVYYRDYTGLEMMRTLREAVLNSKVKLHDYSPVVELLSNEQGHCSGAVLAPIGKNSYTIVKAKAVIMATGGVGRMHLNEFPTSNHLGATGDGLVLAYRLGAKLRDLNSFQYHPTGLAYPTNLAGTLITEGIRSAGTQLLNGVGDRFIDELKPRDIVAAAIIRECTEGRGICVSEPGVSKQSAGVWLDTPTLELQKPGMLTERFPKLVQLGKRSGIDPRQSPLLIYPTLHYQNGGVVIDKNGETTIHGLYCAGETSGGIHGKNRIMGNALLEIISFGRRAGLHAAKHHIGKEHKKITIEHLAKFRSALTKANISQDVKGPMLFPDYTGFNLSSKK